MGGGFLLLCYLYNTLSPKFGGAFQRLSSVVKLIPLLLFAAVGMLFGDPTSIVPPQTGSAFAALGWTAALAPIAFSFDGWIVATSIAHEVRDAKRNLRIALIAAPLLVLAIYLLYFVGVSCYLGPERVMALGDAHIDVMAGDLLGPWGAKAVLVFVLISVMGTVNGLVMGSIRMPHALALRGMVPGAATLERVNARLDIPVPSAILSFAASALWLGLHYWSQRGGWLPNADLSECTVAFSYLFYMAVYFLLIRLFFRGEGGRLGQRGAHPPAGHPGRALDPGGRHPQPPLLARGRCGDRRPGRRRLAVWRPGSPRGRHPALKVAVGTALPALRWLEGGVGPQWGTGRRRALRCPWRIRPRRPKKKRA